VTPIEQLKAMQDLIDDINLVLSENGVTETIALMDVSITDKTVSDLVKPDGVLSEAIINHLWPSIPSEVVYHYTSRSSAEEILNSGLFRLTNIEKRYVDGEIGTFCRTHGLTGYLELADDGSPRYRSLLMPNTYYASFTGFNLTPEREEHLWRNFASCDGVRLKLKVAASNQNFRRIKYEGKSGAPIPLIFDLASVIRNKHGREFILKGISRICSFYLSGEDYGIENEVRALYRVWDGSGPQPIGSGPCSYLELPLGVMSDSGYRIDVLEVQSRVKPTMPESFSFSQRKP
jgi:hypothetical protein